MGLEMWKKPGSYYGGLFVDQMENHRTQTRSLGNVAMTIRVRLPMHVVSVAHISRALVPAQDVGSVAKEA